MWLHSYRCAPCERCIVGERLVAGQAERITVVQKTELVGGGKGGEVTADRRRARGIVKCTKISSLSGVDDRNRVSRGCNICRRSPRNDATPLGTAVQRALYHRHMPDVRRLVAAVLYVGVLRQMQPRPGKAGAAQRDARLQRK